MFQRVTPRVHRSPRSTVSRCWGISSLRSKSVTHTSIELMIIVTGAWEVSVSDDGSIPQIQDLSHGRLTWSSLKHHNNQTNLHIHVIHEPLLCSQVCSQVLSHFVHAGVPYDMKQSNRTRGSCWKTKKLVFYALQLRSIQIQMVARTPVLEYKTVIKYLRLSKCIRKMRNRYYIF